MKAGILVNKLGASDPMATTIRLARRLAEAGHTVWFVSPGRFELDADGHLRLRARGLPSRRFRSMEAFVGALNEEGKNRWVDADDLDLVLLRSNPFALKTWAEDASLDFARLLLERGVLVLNDPVGLSQAANKLYLQRFPEAVRPRTLVTRHLSKIESFLEEQRTIILKPLQGFGGKGVFKASAEDRTNLEPIVRAISRDGYVIAQEYLPEAVEGDTRLFLMNGVPLVKDGRTAVVQRIRTGDDIRSNIHAGGQVRRAELSDTLVELAERARPRLVADGMFLVGLDVIGDKLVEINVFSPGGLQSVEKFEQVDFTQAVVGALERKVERAAASGRSFDNRELATLE